MYICSGGITSSPLERQPILNTLDYTLLRRILSLDPSQFRLLGKIFKDGLLAARNFGGRPSNEATPADSDDLYVGSAGSKRSSVEDIDMSDDMDSPSAKRPRLTERVRVRLDVSSGAFSVPIHGIRACTDEHHGSSSVAYPAGLPGAWVSRTLDPYRKSGCDGAFAVSVV